MPRFHSLALLFTLMTLAAAPTTAPQGDPPPGGVRLLSGYQHKREQGEDSSPGRIWKEGGLEIHYDIGTLAGNQAENVKKAQRVWTRAQVVGDRRVTIVKEKDGRVFVSFASEKNDTRANYPANFNAMVSSDEELTDLLVMALTYRAKD